MSKVFYDHLIDLTGVEKEIKKAVPDPEVREEMIHLIDEIVHHRTVGCILNRLPESNHKEFIHHISDRPHDESVFEYLKGKLGTDIQDFLRSELSMLGEELLEMVQTETKKLHKK